MRAKRHQAGRLGQGAEHGRLRRGEVGGRTVEIPARRVGDAVAALSVGRQAQVVGKYGGAPVAQREHHGGPGLDGLGPQRARAAVLHAGHLHRERRGPAAAPRDQVLAQRAQRGEGVDAGVGPEAAVFKGQRRADHRGWGVHGPVAIFDLSAAIGPPRFVPGLEQEGAVPVQHEGGGGGGDQVRIGLDGGGPHGNGGHGPGGGHRERQAPQPRRGERPDHRVMTTRAPPVLPETPWLYRATAPAGGSVYSPGMVARMRKRSA